MEKLNNIPEEIVLVYCNPTKTDTVYPALVDKKNLDSRTRRSLQSRAISFVDNRENYDLNDIREVTISNSDIILSIKTDKISYYNYNYEVYVRICQKGNDLLDKYKFILVCGIYNFFNLLGNTFMMNNGIISGSYCIQYSSLNAYSFIEDISSDKNLMESRRISKLFNDNKKTSKWIPGGKYYINPTEYVIYLGEYKDKLFVPTWFNRDRYKKCFCSDFGTTYYNNINDKGTISLCIPSYEIDRDDKLCELLKIYESKPLDMLIKELINLNLEKISTSNGIYIYGNICAIKNSSKKGVYDRQLYKNNILNYDLTNELNNDMINYANSLLNGSKSELLLFSVLARFNPTLVEKINNRDSIIDNIKAKLKNDILNKAGNEYNKKRYKTLTSGQLIRSSELDSASILNHIEINTTGIVNRDELEKYVQKIIDSI